MAAGPALVKPAHQPLIPRMVTRSDILVLGLTAGVIGSVTGGLMLGIGMGLVVQKAHIGWLLILPGAPLGGGIGYLLARKLARQLPEPPRR